jgi:hypothetical protein
VHTVSRPADAPILFAVTSSWLIACFAGAFTTKAFEQMDLTRFQLRSWERNGAFYEWCGIRLFRWCIVRTPIGWLNPQMTLRGGRVDLERLQRTIDGAEGPHAIAAVATIVLAMGFSISGSWSIAGWLLLANVPINVYPIMLQRWNRGRVFILQERMRHRHLGAAERPDRAL